MHIKLINWYLQILGNSPLSVKKSLATNINTSCSQLDNSTNYVIDLKLDQKCVIDTLREIDLYCQNHLILH